MEIDIAWGKNGYYNRICVRDFQSSISATDFPPPAYNVCHNAMTSEGDRSSEFLAGHTASADKKA